MFGRGAQLKTPAQVAVMREAGLVVARTLAGLREAVAPGVTTGELDALARDLITGQGATSNFLGYHGFPGVICASVSEEVVHGIPGARVLRDGDLVSIDCGAIVDGWHGDSAITVPVGDVDPAMLRLSEVTRGSMWQGIAALRVGNRLGDIGHAVSSFVHEAGEYGVVEGFTGHGIGTEMHQDPDVPNVGRPGKGLKLVEGMVLAIEPMVTAGSPDTVTLEDDWTVVTTDGSWASHWEHSCALTSAGVWVLTAEDGGAAELASLGVPFGGTLGA